MYRKVIKKNIMSENNFENIIYEREQRNEWLLRDCGGTIQRGFFFFCLFISYEGS